MKKVYIRRNDLFKNLQMVLCNNITKVDEGFFEDNMELFQSECEECNGNGERPHRIVREFNNINDASHLTK